MDSPNILPDPLGPRERWGVFRYGKLIRSFEGWHYRQAHEFRLKAYRVVDGRTEFFAPSELTLERMLFGKDGEPI